MFIFTFYLPFMNCTFFGRVLIILFTLLGISSLTCGQSHINYLRKSIELIEKDRVQLKLNRARFLNNRIYCQDVNEIIRLNNLSICNMSTGNYRRAIDNLNNALKKEQELNSHLDNSILEYNLAIAKLFPGQRFCFSDIDSSLMRFEKISLSHEKFGLNYYHGIAHFYLANYEDAATLFTTDYSITSHARSKFMEVYSFYLEGKYDLAYRTLKNDFKIINEFAGRQLNYLAVLGNVCSRSNHPDEAIRYYRKVKKNSDDGHACKYFVSKSEADLLPFVRRSSFDRDKDCYLPFSSVYYKDMATVGSVFEYMRVGDFVKVNRIVSQLNLHSSLSYTETYLRAVSAYDLALHEYRTTGKTEKFTYAKKMFLKLQSTSGNMSEPDVLIGIAMSAFYCGEHELCFEKLSLAKRLYPEALKIKEAMAILKFNNRDDEGAIGEINDIVSRNSGYNFSYDVVMSAAFYYYTRNELVEYGVWLKKLKDYYKHRAGYYAIKGMELQQKAISTSNIDTARVLVSEAERSYLKAISLEPMQSTFFANYANLLFDKEFGGLKHLYKHHGKKKDFKKVLSNYERAISLDRDNIYAYNGKSMCYYYAWKSKEKHPGGDLSRELKEKIDSAKFYLDKAITLNKKFPMEIHFFKETLISLYLNKQWMLINEAANISNDSLKMELLFQAWSVAEQAMKLDETKRYMFQINQAVGWSMNGKEGKMLEMHKIIENAYKVDNDKLAIVKNNTGVYYSLNTGEINFSKKRKVDSGNSYFAEAKELANSHIIKYYIERNLYSRDRVNIYYYDPITDYRPRNIELNIEFKRPYFNPQIPIHISQMETFSEQDISSEECIELKQSQFKKKKELTRRALLKIEDVDDGVHCPLQGRKRLIKKSRK